MSDSFPSAAPDLVLNPDEQQRLRRVLVWAVELTPDDAPQELLGDLTHFTVRLARSRQHQDPVQLPCEFCFEPAPDGECFRQECLDAHSFRSAPRMDRCRCACHDAPNAPGPFRDKFGCVTCIERRPVRRVDEAPEGVDGEP